MYEVATQDFKEDIILILNTKISPDMNIFASLQSRTQSATRQLSEIMDVFNS